MKIPSFIQRRAERAEDAKNAGWSALIRGTNGAVAAE